MCVTPISEGCFADCALMPGASNPRLFHPSAVAPCSVGVQLGGAPLTFNTT